MRLFEVSDVILLTGDKGCGAANRRRLVAVHCDRAASFEVIHGLLNRVMEVLNVPYSGGWVCAWWWWWWVGAGGVQGGAGRSAVHPSG